MNITTPTFIRVDVDKVINLSHVIDIYINPYGNVSCSLYGDTSRTTVNEEFVNFFLSNVNKDLIGYYEKKVKQRREKEEAQRIRPYRGY